MRLGRFVQRVAGVVVLVGAAVVIVEAGVEDPAGPRSGTAATVGATAAGGRHLADPSRVRVATYNLHSGYDRDGDYSADRIAGVIRDAGVDVVGLQEVNALWAPLDRLIAYHGGGDMAGVFAPTERKWWRDAFGNGLMSRLPVGGWRAVPLPRHRSASGHRNLLVADVAVGAGRALRVIVTHVDRQAGRADQLREAVAAFLAAPAPAVLVGDLNTHASDPQLAALLVAPGVVEAHGPHGLRRGGQIDWIFARGAAVVAAGRVESDASDHDLLWADLDLRADPSATDPPTEVVRRD